jgi:hypothetical protein
MTIQNTIKNSIDKTRYKVIFENLLTTSLNRVILYTTFRNELKIKVYVK